MKPENICALWDKPQVALSSCKNSCLIGSLSTQKLHTVVKVGSGMGQGPATEVPVFSSVDGMFLRWHY